MIVAIHQPNFLPWLGYFYKMARAEHFILLDSVPFAKGSYTNRVKIKTASGPQWLTVPILTKGKLGQPIREVVCNSKSNWQKKIAATFDTNYRKCPHCSPYADEIVGIIDSSVGNLAEMNIQLIRYVMNQLGIDTPTTRSSEMQAEGKATEMLIALCREIGADTYLSGSGGANYQDEADFKAAGLQLIYADYQHPTYRQEFGQFTAGLSIIDLLFNYGPESAAILGV